MKPVNPNHKQRGVALITALLVAALVTVVAVAMASRQQLDIRRTGNMLEADQAYMYALAAESWVTQILKEDKQKTQIDTLTEEWAMKLPPIPIEGGVITGSVEDLQGRFNLNNLIETKAGGDDNAANNTADNGKPDQAQIKILQSLLAQVSFAEEKVQLSPFVANRVADWIDANLNALADGAEDLLYLGLDIPYRTANRLMASSSELAAVAGLSLRDVSALLPLVTALPVSTAVNVNTAPEMVLLSLHEDITPRIATELAAMRVNTAFETTDAFVKKLKDDYDITLDKKRVSVSSEYFLVSSEAIIGRTTLRMYSLLERKDNVIRVVSRGIGSY
ncbi:MAG: type II secretion system minor pseudopilin GspK [Gammaproteobacteria bacterium]|nr:type II secretion system minor pseudopilin GspK [Gammaproteobacteria bacterium]MCF6258971.1 type II secretion system minor pseudopilin GspK [Gammaproteobacteria bacterium]